MAETNSPFRDKAVERLSSPERLDELMLVIKPRGWWWVGSLSFVTISVLTWSILGRIPITVMGQGVLVYQAKVIEMETVASGRVVKLNLTVGQQVQVGDVLMELDQPELNQELQQKENQLKILKQQFARENRLQDQENNKQRQTLVQQRNNYQKQIQDATSFGQLLTNKNLRAIESQQGDLIEQIGQLQTTGVKTLAANQDAINAQRQSLNEQMAKADEMLANLQEIYAKQKDLQAKELITVNIVLQTEQQILQIFDQNASIKSSLKQLESQEAQLRESELNNSNRISDLRNQIQQLEIQSTQTDQSFLENQRKIQELEAELIQVDGQLIAIDLETSKTTNEQASQILALQNEIEQTKLKISENAKVLSEYAGEIIDLQVARGELINPGQSVAKIMRSDVEEELSSFSLFSIGDGKQVKSGMRAEITPGTVQKQDYGGIVGEVQRVSPFPITVEEAQIIIGDASLAQDLMADERTIAVISSLKLDPETYSGYQWSSRRGPDQKITQGTTTMTQVTVDKRAPISFVLPFFRSVTGLE